MNLDIKISCLRCVADAALDVNSLQKVGDQWIAKNAQRPEGWIAGPHAAQDVTKGLCPRCAIDWANMQASFMTTAPEVIDETPVVLRNPIDHSIKPEKVAATPIKVGHQHSTNIPLRNSQTIKVSSIPQKAAPPPMSQGVQNAAPLPATKQSFSVPASSIKPLGAVIRASAPVSSTRTMVASASPQKITGIPVGGTRVDVTQGIKEAPAVIATKIQHAPQLVTSSPLMPQAGEMHGSGIVKTSAPVPLRKEAQLNSMVTISAPVPIEKPKKSV